MALSRREASLRPERARRSRNHFGTVSVWSKIPPRSMPVSPPPVSRGTSSDLWPSIGSSTLVVFKPQLSPWTHSLCPLKTIDDCIFMFWDKTNFIFQIFQTRPKSRDGRFWRARTAELHTNDAKRPETLARGGQLVRAGRRLGGGVWGWDGDKNARLMIGRTIAPLSSSLTSTQYKFSMIKYINGHLDVHKFCEYTLIYEKIDIRVSAQTAVRVCSNWQGNRNRTSQRRRQTTWNLAWVGKILMASHRQGGDCRRRRLRNHHLRFGDSQFRRTYTRLEYPVGKLLEAWL